ncbi:CPBP family intramembrane metalloprotease [Rhodobacterales bacterium HKCCE2091]|nr:CPBP family intramembrane metalloprotease [Rhodobacterales bacterium HKCCE2091]
MIAEKEQADPMQYPGLAAFVAPARAYPQIWRLLVGLLLVAVTFSVVTVVVLLSASLIHDGRLDGGAFMQSMMAGETATGTLVLLATFVGLFGGTVLAARALHDRGFVSLTGSRARRLWQQGAIGALVAAPLLALSGLLPPYLASSPNLELPIWLSFLPLALLLLLVQTGAEELFFRGYVQQQLAARFRSPLVWMVLPSALFALGHYDPATYPGVAWLIVLATFVFAVCAADLTAATGSIGAAWGFHFANNIAAVLFVGIEGPLSGLSLQVIPAEVATPEILRVALFRDIAMTIAIWFLIRLVLTRVQASNRSARTP